MALSETAKRVLDVHGGNASEAIETIRALIAERTDKGRSTDNHTRALAELEALR